MADRWSKLAVAAHVDGALDFSRRGYDQRLREIWVMRELEKRDNIRLHERMFEWHLRRAALKPKHLDYHYRHAEALYANIGRMLMPWKKDWDKIAGTTVQDAWAKFVEIGKDPDQRKRLRQVQHRLEAMVEDDKGKSNELERMAELIRANRRKRRG